MADMLTAISIGSFAAAGVFLVIAIVLFIVFRIPSVLGDLSGRNAKKSIEKMRKNNERTGNKSYSPSITNAKRGKITETIKGQKIIGAVGLNGETGLLAENYQARYEDAETGILGNTTEILFDENETATLSKTASDGIAKAGETVFAYIENVVYIHTEEVI